ncbi:MAG: GlsB/YeaQ/YmgE family stress response membrane protein [Candidatus Moranbacteria bacterium]|nr:GlsB/YeaQ/YmgE family stress response membrane protein [Candidatus Moranbacteria bacterium]
MGIILWIVFGAIVGWIASAVMGTREGLLVDIIFGIVGAVLGGWLMSSLGQGGITGFNLYSFLVAILGAIIVIAIVRAVR